MHGLKTGAECTCKFYIGKPQSTETGLIQAVQRKEGEYQSNKCTSEGHSFPIPTQMHSMNKYTMPRKSTVSSRLFFITMDTSNMIIAKKVMMWGMVCVSFFFYFLFFSPLGASPENLQ